MPSATVGEMLRPQDIAPLDARVLLRAVLQTTDAHIAAHPEQALTDDQRARYLELLARRRAGEPVAYLTGEREFCSLEFRVTPDVLIPRPETELLVERAIEEARGKRSCRVLDLATGSGCVAVAIARSCPDAVVTATDISPAALALARENASRHGVTIETLESDWFARLGGRRFEVIVANPPYIAAGDRHLNDGDTRFEPRQALVAGATGYECIAAIVGQATGHLAPGGALCFEHGYDQAPHCRALLESAGYAAIFSVGDLSGHERVSGGRV